MDSLEETLGNENMDLSRDSQETVGYTKQIEAVTRNQLCESPHKEKNNSHTYSDDKIIFPDSDYQHCNKDLPPPSVASHKSTDSTALIVNNAHVSKPGVSVEAWADSTSTFSTLPDKNTIIAVPARDSKETVDDTKQIETIARNQLCESPHKENNNSQTHSDEKIITYDSDSDALVQHCNKDVPLPSVESSNSNDNVALTVNAHVSKPGVSVEAWADPISTTLPDKNTIIAVPARDSKETVDDTKQIETITRNQLCESLHKENNNSQTHSDEKIISFDSDAIVQHCNKDVPSPSVECHKSTDNAALTVNNALVATGVSVEACAGSTFSTLPDKEIIPAAAVIDKNENQISEQTNSSGSPSHHSHLDISMEDGSNVTDKVNLDMSISCSDSLITNGILENETSTNIEVTENPSVLEEKTCNFQVSLGDTNVAVMSYNENNAESDIKMTEKGSDIISNISHLQNCQSMNSIECNNKPETNDVDSQVNDVQSQRDGTNEIRVEILMDDKPPDDDQCVMDSNVTNQAYRSDVALVNYSDSEDSSSSESDKGSFNNDHDADLDSDLETETLQKRNMKKTESSQLRLNSRLRSNGEIFPEELPPIDYLTISAPEEAELVQLGTVSGIVDILVVIKALQATPALYDDSVLFLENRQPLGLIFETLGTVEQPFYSVRFNSVKDIEEKNICIGDKIMFAPKADNLTKYIFIAELRKIKCDDASWEFDNEPPDGAKDFSDDEEERKAKKGKKASNLKRKKPAFERHTPSDGGDQRLALKQGDLTRNPFGNQSQKFGMKPNSNWPGFQQGEQPQQRSNGGHHSQVSNPQMPQSAFQFQGINTQPNISFGGQPAWLNQPGLMRSPGVMGAFPRGMRPGNFQGNQPSFQGFRQNLNTSPQRFNVFSGNRPPALPFLDLSRPPPSGLTGFRPTKQINTTPFFIDKSCERPGIRPPFSVHSLTPFSGNNNASRFSLPRPPLRRP